MLHYNLYKGSLGEDIVECDRASLHAVQQYFLNDGYCISQVFCYDDTTVFIKVWKEIEEKDD